jgi:hypothetical protein
MDEDLMKVIEAEAHAIHSMPMVNAKKELNKIQTMLMDTNTDVNVKAILSTKRGPLIQRMTALRLEFAKVKEAKINELAEKFQGIDKSEIAIYLEGYLAEYESDNLSETIKNRESSDSPPEKVRLTIPAVYPKPTRSDMAVLLVYFNACSYKNLERNLKLTYQSLIDAEIPVFLVEHLFKYQEPIFPENGTTIFNTRSDSYMFYKENLLNWLMPKVPAQFTKIYMMDCDLIFSSPRWYDDISELLDTHDVVQPFQEAVWLKSNLKTVDMKRLGIVYANSLAHTLNLSTHHPGFAWAFRRDFIEPIGIFDLNVLGSGDSLLALSILQTTPIDTIFNKYLSLLKGYFNIYYELFNNTRQTYYKQDVYHLWHGNQTNRWSSKNRYEQFQDSCKNNNITEKAHLFQENSYGIYEYKESIREEFNKILLDYFKSRDEDSI